MADICVRPTHCTLADAARTYRVHPVTLVRWIKRGHRSPKTGETTKLEAIGTPGRWLIPDGAVDRYLAAVTAARASSNERDRKEVRA